MSKQKPKNEFFDLGITELNNGVNLDKEIKKRNKNQEF